MTVPVAVFAGLLGPLAIAAGAVLLGLPVWIAWLWRAFPDRGELAPSFEPGGKRG